jgi:excisionase family DNA binding protein
MRHRRRDARKCDDLPVAPWRSREQRTPDYSGAGCGAGPRGVIYISGNRAPDETIRIQLEACMSTTVEPLPHLRFEIPEAARILRISRATLYERIREGLITTQKDGRRTFITAAELQRYVIPRS